MMAKMVLAWPNVAALCMVGSTRALSCLWGVSTKLKVRSYHLSSGHSSFFMKRPVSCFQYPILKHRTFHINASSETDSIGSPLMESMEKKIKEHLSADSVVVKDAYGDGQHVSIEVISSAFEGQSAVNRQRMVYKAIWEELQEAVHAVDHMTTRTPSEASGK